MSRLGDVIRQINEGNWDNSDPLGSVKLGVGFDGFVGEVKALAVSDATQTLNTSAAGTTQDVEKVETSSSLRQTLDISVDAGFSGLMFSLEDRLSFFESSEYNSYDFYVVAYQKVRMPSRILNGGDLIQQANQDARSMHPSDFTRKYGDSYVNRIDYGGDLFGILHVSCSTTVQKSAISNSLKLDYGMSLEARLRSAYELMNKVSSVEIKMVTTGGKPSSVDENTFLSFLSSFPKQVGDTGGQPVSFGLSGYETTNWPPGAPPPADLRDPKDWFVQLATGLEGCDELLVNLQRILASENQFDFSGVSLSVVQNEAVRINSIADDLGKQMIAISRDPANAKAPNPIDLTVQWPKMKTPAPPNVFIWVGVLLQGIVNAGSGTWAGGSILDSFGVVLAPGESLDIHFNYTGRFTGSAFVPAGSSPAPPYEMSGSDGTKAGAVGPGRLLALSITTTGKDAMLFDVCYQILSVGIASEICKNGAWLDSGGKGMGSLRVYLQNK